MRFNKEDILLGRISGTGHPLRYVYSNMLTRCYNKNVDKYKRYGDRGILVCNRWLGKWGFTNFVNDVGKRPEGTTLDRIDNNGNYEPNNVRWATLSQQAANRSSPRNKSGYIGVCLTISGWKATIQRDGVAKHLGFFNSIDEAVYAYKKASEQYNESGEL
jgi:hypothetical protein